MISLALISQAVLEQKTFQYHDNLHVYSPGAGADNPQGGKIFSININLLSICLFPVFYLLNSILPFFPIQMHWRPNGTLP